MAGGGQGPAKKGDRRARHHLRAGSPFLENQSTSPCESAHPPQEHNQHNLFELLSQRDTGVSTADGLPFVGCMAASDLGQSDMQSLALHQVFTII